MKSAESIGKQDELWVTTDILSVKGDKCLAAVNSSKLTATA
jgi:hypothetical protein